jgi:hypothetical protein
MTLPSWLRNPRVFAIDLAIAALAIVVGYLLYSLLVRHVVSPPVEAERAGTESGEVIQIDLLNGCGIDGAAGAWAAYLRSRGYDVVEMRNYKTYDVEESLVVDRTGNLENARRVARALGVREENIIQQISEDYYVDVSVVIGNDFNRLKPSQ